MFMISISCATVSELNRMLKQRLRYSDYYRECIKQELLKREEASLATIIMQYFQNGSIKSGFSARVPIDGTMVEITKIYDQDKGYAKGIHVSGPREAGSRISRNEFVQIQIFKLNRVF